MEQKTSVNVRRMGVLHLLTIVFAIAKILGYVSWSWWIVFLPTIISVGLTILILLICLIIACVINR